MVNMKHQTLVFIIGDGQVLLGYKKRGFGEGKWSGYGGDRDDIERLKDCVKREVHVKSNLDLEVKDLVNLGFVQFKENEIIKRRVHVYTCARTSANGILKETEEIKPEWFDFSNVPYDSMWEDAYFWLPFVFKQIPFEATFTLKDERVIQEINIDLHNKET